MWKKINFYDNDKQLNTQRKCKLQIEKTNWVANMKDLEKVWTTETFCPGLVIFVLPKLLELPESYL